MATLANYFWPVNPTTTILTVIPTTKRTAARAADIRMVAVFLVSSPLAESIITRINGDSRLDTATSWTTARTVVLVPQGVRARFRQSSVQKSRWACPAKVGSYDSIKSPQQRNSLSQPNTEEGGVIVRRRASITAPSPPISKKVTLNPADSGRFRRLRKGDRH